MYKSSISISLLLLLGITFGCKNNTTRSSDTTQIALFNGELNDYADSVNAGVIEKDTIKKSVQRSTEINIEGTTIGIQYYAPGVRGRQIWGGLIPYDQVWSAGAHSATRVNFSTDVLVAQTKIPAGDYAFFAIPGKENWTLVLNKNYQQHLADDYSDSLDVVRIQVKPVVLKDTIQRLTYLVKPSGEGTGSINLYWEKLELSMPFTILKNTPEDAGKKGLVNSSLKSLVTKYKTDPVCSMPLSAGITDSTVYKKDVLGFCSPACKALFLETPEKYAKQLKER
jgi:YHS domain-containing protein